MTRVSKFEKHGNELEEEVKFSVTREPVEESRCFSDDERDGLMKRFIEADGCSNLMKQQLLIIGKGIRDSVVGPQIKCCPNIGHLVKPAEKV